HVWKEIPPTRCVLTGLLPYARMQAWYRLHEPSDDFAAFTKLQETLAAAFNGDDTVTNPSRVMRLPGSIAWPSKPQRIKELANAHQLDMQGTDISFADIEERFGQFMPSVATARRPSEAPVQAAARTGFLGLNMGKRDDGREKYMRGPVKACLKQFIGEN